MGVESDVRRNSFRSHGKRSASTSPRRQQAAVPTPGSLRLKDPSKFRYRQGRDQHRRRLQHHDRSRHLGQDVRLPGQKYAVVARPPVMGAKSPPTTRRTKESSGRRPDREIPAPSYPMNSNRQGESRSSRQHLGCDPGPQGAEVTWDDGPHGPIIPRPTARRWRRPRDSRQDPAQRWRLRRRLCERDKSRPVLIHNAHATMEPPAATCRIVTARPKSGPRAKPAGRA